METRTCVVCGAIAHPRDPRCVDCVKRAALEWTVEHHARNIAALANIEAKEGAPKPDELTVDDVLAYLARVIGTSEAYRTFDLTETSPGEWFATDRGDYSAASGTLRGCLEWAKRRGLLG